MYSPFPQRLGFSDYRQKLNHAVFQLRLLRMNRTVIGFTDRFPGNKRHPFRLKLLCLFLRTLVQRGIVYNFLALQNETI